MTDTATMLTTSLNAAMTILSAAAPFVKGAGPVGDIIGAVATILPIVVKEAQDLAPIISETIAVLKQTDDITPEQLAALDAFEAVIDADFDDAAAMAVANDAAVAAVAAAAAPKVA